MDIKVKTGEELMVGLVDCAPKEEPLKVRPSYLKLVVREEVEAEILGTVIDDDVVRNDG